MSISIQKQIFNFHISIDMQMFYNMLKVNFRAICQSRKRMSHAMERSKKNRIY